jgi:DNA adenine methylase
VPAKFSRYYEPFLGGGAVFFSLLPHAATLSDTNGELVQMYVQVRDSPDKVLSCLRRMPNSEEDYYRIRSMKPRTEAGRAARFIYLCTLSFNGIYRQNLHGEFNVPYGYKTHINPCDAAMLDRISESLQGKTLLDGDFEKATSTAGKGDFVYFDPPYTVAHGNNGFIKYNAKIFSWADQKRLASVALRLKKAGCKVIVSNADHASIRELYSGFEIRMIERHSVMAASSEFRRPVRECLFY